MVDRKAEGGMLTEADVKVQAESGAGFWIRIRIGIRVGMRFLVQVEVRTVRWVGAVGRGGRVGVVLGRESLMICETATGGYLKHHSKSEIPKVARWSPSQALESGPKMGKLGLVIRDVSPLRQMTRTKKEKEQVGRNRPGSKTGQDQTRPDTTDQKR